jgi:hypothetical protein
MKVKLISQGLSGLRVANNNVYLFKYDLQKQFSMSKIVDLIKTKIEKIPNYKDRTFRINTKFSGVATNNGWMMSKEIKYNEVKNLQQNYSYLVDSDLQVEDLKARYFEILVIDRPRRMVNMGDTDDNKNDCLFNCILKAFNFNANLLPPGLQRPSSLKKKLSLQRDEKIPVELLPEIEKLYGISFIIKGDIEYTSQNIKKHNICLTARNNHVSVKQNESNLKFYMRYEEVDRDEVYTVCFQEDDIMSYNGESTTILTTEEYNKISKDNNKLLVKVNNEDELKPLWKAYMKKADKMKELTKGFVNFYKTSSEQKIAFYTFRNMTKFIADPEPLDDMEHIILDNAFHGGLHYSQPGEYENCIDYDMNSMYCNYMRKLNFMFPVKKPEYKQMTTHNFNNLQFYPYGLYNVTIKTHHKLWNMKKQGWFTHFDLQIAKMLHMDFSINEHQTNAVLYPSSDCIRGNKAFDEFVTYYTDLENKTSKDYVKPIRNSLWGFFSKKNKVIKRFKKGDFIDIDNYDIKAMINGNNTTTIEMTDNTDIFKFPWARCSIFLTAYCRFQMMKFILDCKNLDDIVAINTDGFVSKTQQNQLVVNDSIGFWKIKQRGNCKVINSNTIIFSS